MRLLPPVQNLHLQYLCRHHTNVLALFLGEAGKKPKLEVEDEKLSTDSYITELEIYLSYFKDSMTSLLVSYRKVTKQLADTRHNNRSSRL